MSVGAPPPPWWTNGIESHGGGSISVSIGHAFGGRLPTEGVPVAVRQHDHVALAGPVSLPVCNRHPAGTASDDVEQDQSFGARVQRVGQRQRRGFDLERVGELRPEEDRALEPKLLERSTEAYLGFLTALAVPRSWPLRPPSRTLILTDTRDTTERM